MTDTGTKPIIISVSLTSNDLEDFYTHTSRKSIVMKMLIACALLIFISQSIHILMIPDALDSGGWKWLLAVAGLFFLLYFINKSNAQREYKSNKKLHETHIYEISEESIHIKGGPFNTIFQWDKLYDMTESKKSFFIWLGKNSAQIIPKRDMTQDDILRIQAIKKLKFPK